MRHIRFLLLILLTLVLAACQPVTPTPTAFPSAPPHTPLPPTATPTFTPLPAIPTADFTLADLIGTWTRSDRDRGNLFLNFGEGGGYFASHGDLEGVVHSGHYTLEDRLFTFVDGWNCAPLPNDTPGRYVVRMANTGQWLFLDLYSDSCPDRPTALRSVRWTRYTP